MVHDDDDAGSAEAHDSVAGSAKFTLKKDGAEFEDKEYCTLAPDLSRLNMKPCISREFAAVLDVTVGRRCTSSDGAREQPLG